MHASSIPYLTPVACELVVTGRVGSDTIVLPDVVVAACSAEESMTQPTWPSTGGFSLYLVFRLHGVFTQIRHYYCVHRHSDSAYDH